MLSIFFLAKPIYWIVPWILQAIGYFLVLRKMELRKWTAVIPILAEWQLSGKLFRKRRSFYRPVVIAVILVLAAWYLDPFKGMGRMFMMVAFAVYGIFLIRLYWKLTKAFGRKGIFAIGLIVLPPIFLLILGFGKKTQFTQPQFKPEKERSRAARVTRRVIFVVISVIEVLVIVLCVAFITVQNTPPAILVGYLLEDMHKNTCDITGTGDVVTREDVLGDRAADIKDMKISREHYFKDHSKDKDVVVLEYIVGSNLEDKRGLASANIRQMMEATEQGDGLKFVIEAGGCDRWFTKGIKDQSYGRYEIAGGKITQIEELPGDTCMSEADTLGDFLTWAKKNYTADRYMLVLWDHGGGVAFGYGQDDLNKAKSGMGTIDVSQVVSAIDKAGIRFDMIGFDACLMQDIEIANALEPYADYYLASEETEGGYGWFYTSAFGKLAKNPGISTEKFGRELVACYDPYNTIIKNDEGKPDTKATLSLVDLTLAAPAYQQLVGLLDEASEAIKDDPASYADVAVAADNAYSFEDNMQIDLIGFLKILKQVDYDDSIWTQKDKAELIRALQASIICRNGDSAKGIHGMAIALPYKNIMYYQDTSRQFKALSLKTEKQTFDEIFSIMAAQQKKNPEDVNNEDESFQQMIIEQIGDVDYTKEDWYIEGFENYDDTDAFIDIPLKEIKDGYQIDLTDKAWKIISDCQTMVYQKVDSGSNNGVKGAVSRYLGRDHLGDEDAKGNPTVAMDDCWVHVGNELVCYEAEPAMETEDGCIFTGKIRARLNGEDDITLNVEWDPVDEDSDVPAVGHITGYDDESFLSFLNEKGSLDLEAGDSIQFLFDYYDKEGNLIKTKPAGGKIRVTKQSRLEVTDKPIGPCEIQFGGVLTDVYQRVMTTEQVEMEIE
ncbi:MAG: clostripain-related cysteine peptidase [Clostridia bacterium]|nr:clostripain-related cysteine peptidase [Clostridia bacterium]